MKAYGLTAIVGHTAQTAYLLPAHLFSLCSPADLNEGDFCPAVIFHDTEVEGKMGKHVSTEKDAGRKRAMEGGYVHSCSALPVNSDTSDNAGSVFRARVNGTSSFFPPSPHLQWKSHIRCHVMRPGPASLGDLREFMCGGLLSSRPHILYSSMTGTLVGSHYLIFLVIKVCVLI